MEVYVFQEDPRILFIILNLGEQIIQLGQRDFCSCYAANGYSLARYSFSVAWLCEKLKLYLQIPRDIVCYFWIGDV